MTNVKSPQDEAASLSSPERVRQHIIEYLIRTGVAGTRLPPVREIAQSLKVSSATVDRAYKLLITEKLIETGVGRGTFIAGKPPKAVSRRYCFALSHVVSTTDTSAPFHFHFSSSVLSAAARFGGRTVIRPFTSEPNDWKEAFDALLEEPESVDGLILSRFMADSGAFKQTIRAYERRGRPVITIHPQNLSWTKNFVSTDFLKTSRRLGRVWPETRAFYSLQILRLIQLQRPALCWPSTRPGRRGIESDRLRLPRDCR
jgi:DNA-binding transcriptional regulator YhcF (GntR family)